MVIGCLGVERRAERFLSYLAISLSFNVSERLIYALWCVCVYYCRTFYKAVRVGEEESGGHVL